MGLLCCISYGGGGVEGVASILWVLVLKKGFPTSYLCGQNSLLSRNIPFKTRRSWTPPARIKDNMTAEERKGMEMVLKDKDNIYRMEDKGSSVVRMDKSHYVKNVTSNLEQSNLYEKVDEDNTEEIKNKVTKFVDKLERNGRMPEKTANYIKAKIEKTRPGA